MARLFFSLLLGALLTACTPPAGEPADTESGQNLPEVQLTNYAPGSILTLRSAIEAEEETVLPAFDKLLELADECLEEPIYTVMQKTVVPPSGDKHDYLTLAPYWWPDPSKADGLPWIRKDGEVNPKTKDRNTDDLAKDRAFDHIEKLSMAAYFSGEEKYAKRAVEQINAWFLDPATRMNPNLNYGQGIPGRNDGRCFGIIEFNGIQRVINGLELLEAGGQLPEATKVGMQEWLTEVLDWLQTSELGLEEGSRLNNHANWYDVQVVCILRYLGRDAEAREVLEAAKEKRIATQIEADGSQPHELARTKSMSYSRMNLEAMTRLAWHGKQLGVDLWNFTAADGQGIPTAYEFLRPYAFGEKPWPHQQLGDIEKYKKDLREMFYRTGAMMEVAEFCALQPDKTKPVSNIRKLFFPCP